MDTVSGSYGSPPSSLVDGHFFAALAENVPAIVYSATPDGRMEFFNRWWYTFTGLTHEQTLNDARGFRDAIHPEDRDRTSEAWNTSMRTGTGNTIEARVRRSDGVYRWHRSSLVPFRAEDGTISRWIGCVYDVDEQQSAERTMRTLGDIMPMLVWTATPDGHIDYYNERWRAIFVESDEPHNGQMSQLVHPYDRPDVVAAFNGALEAGNGYTRVFRLCMRDGRYRWHRLIASPLRDATGEIVKWFGLTTDIHDDLTAHAVDGRDVEAQLVRDMARRTQMLLFMVDADGNVIFTSEEWSELTGLAHEQLLGQAMNELIHPEDRPHVRSTWEARDHSGATVVMQYRLRRGDGAYRWIETRSRPDIEPDGTVRQWVGVGYDIDEHKRALKALEYLVQTSSEFARGTTLEDRLRGLAGAALDGMADLCFIDMLDTAGAPAKRLVVSSSAIEPGIAESIAQHASLSHVPSAPSFITVPIVDREATYGTITLLRTSTSTPFERDDMRVLEDVARRAALAIANTRLRESLEAESRDRTERFRRIADSNPQITFAFDADGSVDWINRRWYDYTGSEEREAHTWYEALHPIDREELRERWDCALESGEAFSCEARVRDRAGHYRWFLMRAIAERGVHGSPVKWYASLTDVHEARRASRTLGAFADLGAALTETLGLQQTLDAVMLVLVPEYADWSFITLADEEGVLRIAAIEAASAPDTALLRRLVGKTYVKPGAIDGSRLAMDRRAPMLITEHLMERAAMNLTPEAFDVMTTVGFSSVLSIPIVVNGVVRGAIVVCNSREDRSFDPADIPFYQEIARRAAPAIANAELYERERQVARSFQEAALPAELPEVPSYSFHAVYEAGRAEALVGGDWYDAFTLLDGRIVLSIGDVAGAGLRAAVLMSSVRQTIRGVAQVHADPALMLEAADRTVSSEHPDRYVTAFVGVLDPMTNEMLYQSAGHLPPLILKPDASVVEVPGAGLPLGLRGEHEPENRRLMLQPGSLLVLFTDGLVESTHDLLAGERQLRSALRMPSVRDADDPAEAVHDALLADGSKDDVAILAVRIGTPIAVDAIEISGAHDQEQVRAMRRAILSGLRDGGLSDGALQAAELIIAELIGNLARYAPGPASVSLTWNGRVPVLHVLDSGPGYYFAAKLPADPFSESGRGLFLIASLARNFVVTPRAEGGSYSRIVFKR